MKDFIVETLGPVRQAAAATASPCGRFENNETPTIFDNSTIVAGARGQFHARACHDVTAQSMPQPPQMQQAWLADHTKQLQ